MCVLRFSSREIIPAFSMSRRRILLNLLSAARYFSSTALNSPINFGLIDREPSGVAEDEDKDARVRHCPLSAPSMRIRQVI